MTQAWRVVRRLVARHDVATLLKGLERFRVVSIALDRHDDPQQIFESINATGRPLTETEKVKNWLLIGLPEIDQRNLYNQHWIKIESHLGAEHTTAPIDIFLRDLLRWKTGEVWGVDRTYEGLRRWAVRQGQANDRSALCRELARLAELYGILTGTRRYTDPSRRTVAPPLPAATALQYDRTVERELRHLRAMGIDVYRPLALRLLHDASGDDPARLAIEKAGEILRGISRWTTRLWLSGRATAGMNTAMAELAHGPGPRDGEKPVEHWIGKIRALRHTRAGVPDDEAVKDGIRTRKAYGGSATQSTTAVLCALMEKENEQTGEKLDRASLSIEHVMPKKLTQAWRTALGDRAEELHGQQRDRLPNLTLLGERLNSKAAARPFEEKREKYYAESKIKMTQRLAVPADYPRWDEAALERRAEELASTVLALWPWDDPRAAISAPGELAGTDTPLRWRIADGPWHSEEVAAQMVRNVAGALLSRDPANAERLSGDTITGNIHPASRYPDGTKAGSMIMRAVPGHEQYVLYPHSQNYPMAADRCRTMGERCDVSVEVLFPEIAPAQPFWQFFRKHTGGYPGQHDDRRRPRQWTTPMNATGDMIELNVLEDWLQLRVVPGEAPAAEKAARMRRYSQTIRDEMGDQEVHEAERVDRSVSIQRHWARDDESEWPEAAQWLKEQHDRLRAILIDSDEPAAEPGEREEDGDA